MKETLGFNLQRIVDLSESNSELWVDIAIERAKHNFPVILENRSDSLLGRGHHESYHLYVPNGQVVCFLWDEDHDERLFIAAAEVMQSLQSDNVRQLVQIFSERKANFFIVTDGNENAKRSLDLNFKDRDHKLLGGNDIWEINVVSSDGVEGSGIINDDPEAVGYYIRNLLDTVKALTTVHECLELRGAEVAVRKKTRKDAKR